MTPVGTDPAAQALDEAQQAIDQAARQAFDAAVAEILAGADARDAIARAFERFTGPYAQAMADALSAMLQAPFQASQMLTMTVGDLPLSARLYAQAGRVSQEVAAIVRQHAQGVHDARALALSLYDGYDAANAQSRPLEGRARATLPKALRSLTADLPTRQSLERTIRRGLAQAERLKSPALRAAYSEALTAWEKGAAQKVLTRKLEVAAKEKTRHFANRIAQTELARTHQHAVARKFLADATLSVVEVMINPTHPHTDVCDLHARANLWGLGPGCYPKAKAPVPPYHPFCRCMLRSRPDLRATDASSAPASAADYLRSLPEGEAAKVMGSQAKAARTLAGEPAEAVLDDGVPKA